MVILGKIFSAGVEVALVAIAIGLLVRGRWRLSWAFDIKVLAILIFSTLNTWWPSRFYGHGFWLITQTTLDLLRFCVALEMGWRTFRRFPGARSTALHAALAVLAVTLAVVTAVPLAGPGISAYRMGLAQFHPRVIAGTVWLMVAILALARWYRVPIHPFHAAILASLAIYSAIYLSFLSLMGRYGPDFQDFANRLDGVTSLVLMGWWVHVTWRRESATSVAYVRAIQRLEGPAWS